MKHVETKKLFLIFLWLITNIAIQIGIPTIYYIYLSKLLDYEYESGIRTSSDGDIILIPAAGMFVLVFFVLTVINIIGVCYLWASSKRRNGWRSLR